jgi:hypothetical protein
MPPDSTSVAEAGKETGQQMTHIIVPDGAYARRAYRKLAATGHQINWQSQADDTVER